MKLIATFMAVAALVFSTAACSQYKSSGHDGFWSSETIKGSKNYVTKEIKVDNFTGIAVKGSADVVYTQKAGKPHVEVYTSDNIVDWLDIQVKGGQLSIGFKKGARVSYQKLEVRVSSEKLDKVRVSGSGDILLAKGLKGDRLDVSVAGSGNVHGNDIACTGNVNVSVAGSGDVDCKSVACSRLGASVAGSGDMRLSGIQASGIDVSVSGSGTLVLGGKAQEAGYSVSGSGDVDASGLQAVRVSASVSGSGDIKCHATEYLKARTAGSGSIGYKGNPEVDYPKKQKRYNRLYKL